MWIFPPILAGITSLWFGTGMLIILFLFNRFVPKIGLRQNSIRIIPSLLFIPLVALITAILCGSLLNAINWEIGKLNLKPVVLQLLLLSSIGGGVLLAAVFCRITVRMPQAKKVSLVGIVSFIFGAAIILPITWLLTIRRSANLSWRVLLLSVLGASGFIVYLTLFANIFNPWFTAFSFLKGIILKPW